MSARKPYAGTHRKLVVGIDVGTTFSGVSYCILDPDVVPVIRGVNRWVGTSAWKLLFSVLTSCSFPAQERSGGDAKIPTVLYYDRNGTVRAAGAEVLHENNIDRAGDQQWVKAEWYLSISLFP